MTAYTHQLRRTPGLERCSRREISALARVADCIDVPAGGVLVAPDDRRTGAVVIVDGDAVREAEGWNLLLPAGSRIERHAAHATGVSVRARTDVRARWFPVVTT